MCQKQVIPLASSVIDAAVYPPVEKALGIELQPRYALDGVKPRRAKGEGW